MLNEPTMGITSPKSQVPSPSPKSRVLVLGPVPRVLTYFPDYDQTARYSAGRRD